MEVVFKLNTLRRKALQTWHCDGLEGCLLGWLRGRRRPVKMVFKLNTLQIKDLAWLDDLLSSTTWAAGAAR